ncbi:putative ribonuclease H-like domain-containing protein [Tanacetum coccineum]
MKELLLDDKLNFVEEPVEIIDREIKQLKQSHIPIVKVRWNSKRGDQNLCGNAKIEFVPSYPHLNIVPKGGLTCLFAIATSDESKLWHRRLGHLNFKTMNKLVKENLVRGLPSKLFENDQTCVACLKGKQHRAFCKSKTENSINLPLHLLHMDLFGLTFVKSLKKKMYCLVVTDDYNRFTWVFFLATKDETSGILKSFIARIENTVDHKVKVIRYDNGTEFKNREMNQFCDMKGILRQFSVTRTPQQNGVAKRRNRTLIEVARTMLADSKTPTLSFMRPFGFPVTILNTIDHLSKFDGKADEGFFVRYSLNSKVFRVFNSRTRIVEENFHIRFSESTPNIAGSGPDWLFDIDALTRTMNYEPIVVDYILLPLWTADPPFSQDLKSSHDDGSKPSCDDGKKVDEDPRKESECNDQDKEDNVNNNNTVNTVSSTINVAGTNEVNAVGKNISIELPFDPKMPALEDDSIFGFSSDDEDDSLVADINNLDTTIQVRPIPTIRIHKDHPLDQVIRDLQSATLTRKMMNPKRNKKDDRVIVIRNKARLVTQGYTQEEEIDYDEVFALVARTKEIRLFLAYASFKDFVVYQMDVKSAFLYKNIEFEDPYFPDRVYKVEKALYGLHQAPRAWLTEVKTTSTPMETQKPLLKDEDGKEVDVHMYRSMIGSLIYLTSSRPDIMFAVCAYARDQVNPKVSHLHVVKGFLAYNDSDYAGGSLDKKSTIGGCQFLRCRLISWQCKKQTVVANSTIEAEYFRSTIKVKTINGEAQLHALVDGKEIIITESSVRRDLQLADEQGSAILTDPHHTPTIIQPLTQPQKTQQPRKPKRKDTRIPQPSGPTNIIADEAVHKELGDSLVRAATTASSLEAEQDSGNITKTRSKEIPNESSSLGTTSGSGPRGNTLQSDADSLKLKELMELCTNLQQRNKEVAAKDVNLNVDEVTLAQALVALKSVKSKVKGGVIEELSVPVSAASASTKVSAASASKKVSVATTTATIPTPRKGIVITELGTPTITRSSQQPSQAEVLDKGKGKMIEPEPVKPKKKVVQIMLDKEAAKKLQA